MRRQYENQENIPLHVLSGQESEGNGGRILLDSSELPSRKLDDFSGQRIPLRRRTWTRQCSAAVNDVVDSMPSRNLASLSAGEAMPVHFATMGRRPNGDGLEQHAAQIVNEMEQDLTLMEDTPQAEQLRMETLREMPESLTMKRTIRRKLTNTVSQKSKRSPISLWKRMKYRCSMSMDKLKLGVKNLLYSFELWYQGIKVIEGHFGSGVATYFKFHRWLFILDLFVCLLSVSFVVIPQLLYRFYEPLNATGMYGSNILYEHFNTTDSLLVSVTPLPVTFPFPQFRETRSIPVTTLQPQEETEPSLLVRSNPYQVNRQFAFRDIFTGEGFFTNTSLFYGYYANDTLHLTSGTWYSIPNAYFFTALCCYLFLFVSISISMARSYRRSFIETSGGLKNVYAHKIFCGWDFSIATTEAAELKSKSIHNELKELLSEASVSHEERSFKMTVNTFIIQASLNVLCLVVISGTATLVWYLLDSSTLVKSKSQSAVMLVPVIITFVMIMAPILFSWFLRFEEYKNPRTALYVTLTRTFLLEVVIVSVLVAFWLGQTAIGCWETSLGQEIYRLILMDFIFTIIGTALAEFIRRQLFKCWSAIGIPEFDIAHNTLNLIYNQTLFWVGAFFSPLLSVIIVIKMFITFYVKKFCLLKNCQPSTRSWRAAQTHTVFLVLSFLSLLGVVLMYGFIITRVHTSKNCGPFRDYDYMYQMILEGVFQLQDGKPFWKLIMFLTKPGVVAGYLLAMCVVVYYLRAKAHACQEMVMLLREMLLLEAKDKEFLLSNISKVTEGRWMYNLPHNHPQDPPGRGVLSTGGGDHVRIKPQFHGSASMVASHDLRHSHSTSSPNTVSSVDSISSYEHRGNTGKSLLKDIQLQNIRSNTSVEPTSSSDDTYHYPRHIGVQTSSSDEVLGWREGSDGSGLMSDDGLNDYEGSRIRKVRNKHMHEGETSHIKPGWLRRY